MGNLQSNVNAVLGTATKIEKLYKPLKKVVNQLDPWQKAQQKELVAIHKDQMKRIKKKDAKSGEKVYVPEDLQNDPGAMGPRPYTAAAFGADGFEMHDPSLAQSIRAYKIDKSGQIVEKNTTAHINGRANQKERLKNRIQAAKDGTYLTVANINAAKEEE